MNPDPPAADPAADDVPAPHEMRAFAERLLARREYGVLELRARLLRKWPDVEQVEQRVGALIAALEAEGALSDERFAESFVRSRLRRCQGPARIRAELRQRRVPEAVIERQLGQVEEDWVRLASNWLARQATPPLNHAAKGKYYRRLTNRGFSHQQAMDALASLNRS